MPKYEHTQAKASIIVAIGSLIGLTICFVSAVSNKAEIPLYLYAIFGGGILGTDNIIRLLKTIFRIGDE